TGCLLRQLRENSLGIRRLCRSCSAASDARTIRRGSARRSGRQRPLLSRYRQPIQCSSGAIAMHKLVLLTTVVLGGWISVGCIRAAELHLPQNMVAGQDASVGTEGSGDGTLFLLGPGQVVSHNLTLGNQVQIKGEELRSAGRWVAVLRTGGHAQSTVFWVKPGPPENLSFLARPSRVPVAVPDVIYGTAFVF